MAMVAIEDFGEPADCESVENSEIYWLDSLEIYPLFIFL